MKVIAVAGQDPGALDRWRVDGGVAIVVLEQRHRLLDGRARHEGGAHPVMDEPAGHVDLLSLVAGHNWFDEQVAARALREALVGVAGHPLLGQPDVAVEGRDRFRPQVSRTRRDDAGAPRHGDCGHEPGQVYKKDLHLIKVQTERK